MARQAVATENGHHRRCLVESIDDIVDGFHHFAEEGARCGRIVLNVERERVSRLVEHTNRLLILSTEDKTIFPVDFGNNVGNVEGVDDKPREKAEWDEFEAELAANNVFETSVLQ